MEEMSDKEEYMDYLQQLGLEFEKLPIILNGDFFRITDLEANGNIRARCMNCTSAQRTFGASLRATSNLLIHMKRTHKNSCAPNEYNKLIADSKKKRRATGPHVPASSKKIKYSSISKDRLNEELTCFISNVALPISFIENDATKRLVHFLNPEVTLPNRRTLQSSISSCCAEMMKEIKMQLKGQILCTTADLWSTKHASFMGVTCHWITNDLRRKSVALACRKFESPHTYERIAEKLEAINNDFDISFRNIVSTVTDNASNFIKCFKEFNINVGSESKGNDDDNNDDDDNENNAGLILPPLLVDSNEPIIHLPSHKRCICHTINLIATIDIKKSLKGKPSLNAINHTTFGKCSALWNAAGRPKTSEKFFSILNCQLRTPVVTRWSSLYNSVSALIKHEGKLPQLCDALGIARFKDAEVNFLEEYMKILQPLAVALEKLQGEKRMYYGFVIPTLMVCRKELVSLKSNKLIFCEPLLNAAMKGLDLRFNSFFSFDEDSKDAVIATVTHPFFKLKWLNLMEEKEEIRQKKNDFRSWVIDAAQRFVADVECDVAANGRNDINNNEDDDDDNYYRGMEESGEANEDKMRLEVMHYLQDNAKHLSNLDKYPIIKKMFIYFNTTLPSSAPVERLFSLAKIICEPHRNRLSHEHFEELVLLKANKFNLEKE